MMLRLTALFKMREGRALAKEGRAAEARRAIAQGRSLFFDGTVDLDPPCLWWFEQHELLGNATQAEADLGNWDAAPCSKASAGIDGELSVDMPCLRLWSTGLSTS